MIITYHQLRCDGCRRCAPECGFMADRMDRQKVRTHARRFGWKRVPSRQGNGVHGRGADVCPTCLPAYPDAK